MKCDLGRKVDRTLLYVRLLIFKMLLDSIIYTPNDSRKLALKNQQLNFPRNSLCTIQQEKPPDNIQIKKNNKQK